MARIETQTATNTPVDASLNQLNVLNEEQTREVGRQLAQQAIPPSPQEPAPVRAIAR